MITPSPGRLHGDLMRGKRRFYAILLIPALAAFLALLSPPMVAEGAHGDAAAWMGTPPVPRTFTTPTPTALAVASPAAISAEGCCANPFWSQDSDWVLFLDSREGSGTGLYALPRSGGAAFIVHPQVGVYSRDLTLVAYLANGRTYIERWADGTRWEIPSEGQEIFFSPDGDWISWNFISSGVTFPNLRQRAIWVARTDGQDARELVTVIGGEFLGWTADAEAILVSGRLAPDMPAGIWRIELENGAGRLLEEVEVPLRVLVSPGGEQVAFIRAFEEPGTNGLVVAATDGSGSRILALFGSYRWLDEENLLVIPMDMAASGPSLWRVHVGTGEEVRWLDLTRSGERILNNDWAVSPDGQSLVFRAAGDGSLWVLTLPEPR